MAIIHRWEKRDDKTQRYYEAYVFRDLLDDLFLVTRWGSIGSALGRSQQQPLMHCADGDEALALVDKQRIKRGYARCQSVSV